MGLVIKRIWAFWKCPPKSRNGLHKTQRSIWRIKDFQVGLDREHKRRYNDVCKCWRRSFILRFIIRKDWKSELQICSLHTHIHKQFAYYLNQNGLRWQIEFIRNFTDKYICKCYGFLVEINFVILVEWREYQFIVTSEKPIAISAPVYNRVY